MSEKYVSPDVWSTELNKIIERKGLVDTEEISVPTKNLQTKLKKIFNRVNLGQDVGLILPNNLSFNDVDFQYNVKTIQISIILEKKNG